MVKDTNLTQRGVDFDGFGRVVRSTLIPPGQSIGVLSTLSYLGFSEADPLGRRIVGKSFTDPVPPGSEGMAVGRTRTVYLDELGRKRRTEIALGADYANQTLIAGARTYDSLGRVAFEADPFPSSQDAATAYGTTQYFNTDGSPTCFIRGRGPQLLTGLTDEHTERYPTCVARSFNNHMQTVSVIDAAALVAGSPQAGVVKVATSTAIGRILSRSTWKNGTRYEHATFAYDLLGQLTGMTRFQDCGLRHQPGPVVVAVRFARPAPPVARAGERNAIQHVQRLGRAARDPAYGRHRRAFRRPPSGQQVRRARPRDAPRGSQQRSDRSRHGE
jgi:hypothetical protein